MARLALSILVPAPISSSTGGGSALCIDGVMMQGGSVGGATSAETNVAQLVSRINEDTTLINGARVKASRIGTDGIAILSVSTSTNDGPVIFEGSIGQYAPVVGANWMGGTVTATYVDPTNGFYSAAQLAAACVATAMIARSV